MTSEPLDPSIDHDFISFESRLAEAIAWCHPRASVGDPAGSLRSEQLRPRMLEVDRAAAVRWVADARQMSLRLAGQVHESSDRGVGRLLAYLPDMDLADGAAELESKGFFDINNTPPWDTWIALFRDPAGDISSASLLVCWVPDSLVDLADRGIRVNPEECILWLADSHVPIAEQLRSAGHLV